MNENRRKNLLIPSPLTVILLGVSIPSRPAAYMTCVMIIMGHRAVIVIDGVMNRNIIRLIHHLNRSNFYRFYSNRDHGLQFIIPP
jgi:hypothetical protein